VYTISELLGPTDPDGQVAGVIQYSESPQSEFRHAGVDVFLGTRWQGRGLGPEAIRAVVEHLFGRLGHHRAVVDPAAANERAIRAYERVGFRRVGLLRRYQRGPDGSYFDGLLMELLSADFRPAAAATKSALPLALRTATPADVPELLELMVEFNRYESIAWTPAEGEMPLRHLLAHPELGLVLLLYRPLLAEPAGSTAAAVGYAVLSFGYDLEFGGRDAFLTELYLKPAMRGQGLGQTALERIVQTACAHGAGALHLQVRAENTAAQRLYRGAGFVGTTRMFLSKNLRPPPPST
jgi:RimJ/RimL family protein N-acetyltransferase